MAPKQAVPAVVTAVTEALPETAQACWEVRGFSFLDMSKDKVMESPPLLETAGLQWFLRVYWGGYANSPEGMSIFCGVLNLEAGKPVRAQYNIRFLGKEQEFLCLKSTVVLFQKGEARKGFTNVATLDRLKTFLENDALLIELKVTAWAGDPVARQLANAPGSSCAKRACSNDSPNNRDALANDWMAFLSSGLGTDVEVCGSVSKSDEARQPEKAHWAVLAARSSVFNRMLVSGMREQRESLLRLDGADQDVVQKFLRFLYTGELEQTSLDDQDVLCHLLALGHKYEVPSLVAICSAHMTLSDESAAEGLMMAEQLGLAELKEQVMEYICGCRTRLISVQGTEGFGRLATTYPKLLVEILARVTQPPEKRARVSPASV